MATEFFWQKIVLKLKTIGRKIPIDNKIVILHKRQQH
jgi:hypothetical protein